MKKLTARRLIGGFIFYVSMFMLVGILVTEELSACESDADRPGPAEFAAWTVA